MFAGNIDRIEEELAEIKEEQEAKNKQIGNIKYKNRSFRRESATDYIFLSTGHSGFTQKKQGLRRMSKEYFLFITVYG